MVQKGTQGRTGEANCFREGAIPTVQVIQQDEQNEAGGDDVDECAGIARRSKGAEHPIQVTRC